MDTDYERLVVDYLNGLGLPAKAYYDVPRDRPVSFIIVLRTGGGHREIVMERPSFAIDCWAKTRRGAEELARSVQDAMQAMPEAVDNVFGCTVDSVYRNPDPDTGTPRYSITLQLDTCV